MDDKILDQLRLYRWINDISDNMLKAAKGNLTLGAVESRLMSLEKYKQCFDVGHISLLALHKEEIKSTLYWKSNQADQAEEAYVTQRGILLDHKAVFVPEPVPSTSQLTVQGKSSLRKLQLPTFEGKYEEWPAFRDLFTSMIDREADLSKVEKLQHLKVSLKGDAATLVKDIPTNELNYSRTWRVLTEHYENTRILVSLALSKMSTLAKMKSESATDLNAIFLRVTSMVNSLEGIGRPVSSHDDLLVYLVVELFDSKTRNEWEMLTNATSDPPTFDQLKSFMDRRIQALSKIQALKPDSVHRPAKNPSSTSGSSARTRVHLANKAAPSSGRCQLCRGDHPLMFCDAYKTKSELDRRRTVEQHRLCFNCLGKHNLPECGSMKTCYKCHERHHTSLHDVFAPKTAGSVLNSNLDLKGEPASRNAHLCSSMTSPVLLATARVLIADRHGNFHPARALVDQGSEVSMVTERMAQRLNLKRASTSVAIFGIGGMQTGVARGRISLQLRSTTGTNEVEACALVMPRLSAYASRLSHSPGEWNHLKGLNLADSNYSSNDPIDLILGADIYATILLAGLGKGKLGEPIAQNTTLGWILSGRLRNGLSPEISSLQCSLGDPLSRLVRSFWEQEEASPTSAPTSAEELKCEEHFVKTHSRNEQGRYVVRLPFKSTIENVFHTKTNAQRALRYVEAKFKRNPDLQQLYVEFMRQYESLEHMSKVPTPSILTTTAYLPHHGVLRESSSTTRLRVVFNGSAKTFLGTSLNEQLLTGPNLLPALADVLLKWRMHKLVFVTDIEKMYRQILVDARDRDWQRILWRYSENEEMSEYQLNTVTYGLACAPYLAIRTLHQLARDEASTYPLGSEILLNDMYVDDVLTGANSEEQLLELKNQLISVCKAGGFPLQKWASNSTSLLMSIHQNDSSQVDPISFSDRQATHSTLGLLWHPNRDVFSFTVKPADLTNITRRTILSQSAQLFDPLGWLTPVTVRAKIFIQNTWLLKVGWDSPLPETLTSKWSNFRNEWPLLTAIELPRPVTTSKKHNLELVGFCDASEQAYAAVLYLRQRSNHGNKLYDVSLLSAKSKVAPLKQVSLPRLELCAAVLLARLTHRCREVLKLDQIPVHLWSDSTVALGWIRGHPNKWNTYVANRVSEVQRTLSEAHWHHIAGSANPADCASRGIAPKDLLDHPLWWKGPPLLQKVDFPLSIPEVDDEDLPEKRRNSAFAATCNRAEENPMLEKFSTYLRLLRVTAWCRRWLPSMRQHRKDEAPRNCLSASELEEAETTWIRLSQLTSYPEELLNLQRNKSVKPRSPLSALTPFLDSKGVLRMGGRLKYAALSLDQKYNVILSPDSKFTELLVKSVHRATLHGGIQLTLSSLRQRFWVPRGRNLVKRIIHQCVTCARWRAATPQALMGSFPSQRITPSRPFQFSGVDYAGPYHLRTAAGRGHKSYKGFLVIFVCLSTKALHLDVASSYTSEAFIATFKRFISRRGLCSELYSDQGSNFIGADAELRRMFTASSKEFKDLVDYLSTLRVKWKFNPPATPHFGGLWEAAVKSTKYHLRRVLGSHTLTYEEMATLLAQVEACLNSRPLCALSDDPEDLQSLTPGHFLVGSALNALPEPSLLDTKQTRLSRWQLLSQLRNQFWKKWSNEYLQGLSPRSKWRTQGERILPGSLCVVMHESTPPSTWPLARISATHAGKDGHVRVVTVKTATRCFDRPISKIVLLPIASATANDLVSS